MTTWTFWRASLERAIKTVAQVAVSMLVVGATGILDVDWLNVASAAALAGVISLLTSIGSDAVTSSSGPSLAGGETLDPPGDHAA